MEIWCLIKKYNSYLMSFSILITCLLDNVRILEREVMHQSPLEVKGLILSFQITIKSQITIKFSATCVGKLTSGVFITAALNMFSSCT